MPKKSKNKKTEEKADEQPTLSKSSSAPVNDEVNLNEDESSFVTYLI